MYSYQKIRRFELIFVLSAIAAYVIRRLIELARDFENDIRLAQKAGVSNHKILQDLLIYDHNLNSIFPTVAAAIFFAAAWYVFHFWAYPKIKELNKESQILDYQVVMNCLLTISFVFLSVFIYDYFRLYTEVRPNLDNIKGLKVHSDFRKLYLFTNTFAGVLVILLYELAAQIYYFTCQLYEERKQKKHKFLIIVMLILAIFSITLWVFIGRIANVVLGRGLTGIPIILFLIIFSIAIYWFFFNIVFPFFAKIGKTTIEKYVFRFLGFCAYFLVGMIFFAIIFEISHHDGMYFVALFLIPNILGLFSAIIRWYFFVENQQLQTQLFTQSAELSSLRSQINPHFLFNALNTLYAVSLKENAEKTANGVQKLGEIMRFMLHENHQDRIPLSKEVEYLQNFIEIQRMRIDESNNIEIRVNLQKPEREIYISPMLLNPFVENAFKHGISFRNPSWIYITLTLDAQKIYFKVHNSLHQKTENSPESEKSGVGLENVKKRLELIYPNRHTLEIQESEQDYFVSLTLTYW